MTNPYLADIGSAGRARREQGIPTLEQLKRKGMTDAEAQDEINAAVARQEGGGMTANELQDFETLVGRLEGSKMRQAAQSNRARQRDTFAGGLASMMSNF